MPSTNGLAIIRSTCPYCGVGCGVAVNIATLPSERGERSEGGEAEQTTRYANFTINGDKLHPANFGRLCSKGVTLTETLDSEGGLL